MANDMLHELQTALYKVRALAFHIDEDLETAISGDEEAADRATAASWMLNDLIKEAVTLAEDLEGAIIRTKIA